MEIPIHKIDLKSLKHTTMSTNTLNHTYLTKEELHQVEFSKSDVLPDINKQKERSLKLHKALLLGNNYKTHVKILFRNKHYKLIYTEATIWAVTESYVILKSRVLIPIRSVVDVLFQ